MGKPTIDQLRDQVRATVITAQDLGYDEARAVRNGMFDKNPKAVICAEQVADVIAAVNFARDAGLELAVRGGGHSAPGFGTTDGGVVLDLSLMRGVHVGSQTATARAGGGATWGDFNCATHAFGLATTGGISSTTGVGGLTLGGGIGYLARPYGLSIDNLRSAEVVTADGRVLMASEDENADLFWALRGGGDNFGVVTSFEFQLHPVADIYAGIFLYELDSAADLLRFFRDFIPGAPEAYGAFPASRSRRRRSSSRPTVWATPCAPPSRVGPGRSRRQEGHGAVPRYRRSSPSWPGRCPTPRSTLRSTRCSPKASTATGRAASSPACPTPPSSSTSSTAPRVPEVSATIHLYPINGACHRVGADDAAFAYRDATFAQVIVAAWQDPAHDADRIRWVRDYHEATAPYAEAGGYVNFMADDDGGRVQDNYRAHYQRLAQVKRRYDPGNLFHLNQNIPPST